MHENKDVIIQNLTLSIRYNNNCTQLIWKGESDGKEPSQKLMPFINEFVNQASGKLKIVFNELTYMNSSTIHPLIMLFKMLNEKNVKTEVTYNKNSKWQEASFKALQPLMKILTNITVVGT
jgi:hypothetical protein